MYALPAPPWASKNAKTKKMLPPGSNQGAGKKGISPVSYLQAPDAADTCVNNTEECQIHDSLLEQDADLALTNKGFYSSKLCLINTESEDSDAESEDIDTTEYNTEQLPPRRPDGYSATLQESMI